MTVAPRVLEIADHLLLIERELQVQGWWSDTAPSDVAMASTVPFAVDAMPFEQWLQWIFLPRMKQIIEFGQPLPNASGILVMAETVFASRAEQSRELRRLLAAFDRLIAPSA
ncbi:YqcC family protein [Pseudomonas cremoricolorata]|uniref:Pseudouridine synthase n=1 Tax=Pseudomonas cremoricolorata TaxID=157783 RepID=A0A089WHW9_9PSED|nr:YqcC family protein [Pseudomonas cremoricolorata]AIR88166.1 pseudouridine synthase [Pseudomonas cremoricolorata]